MKKSLLLGTIFLICIVANAETHVKYKDISYISPGKLIKGTTYEEYGAYQFTYYDEERHYSIFCQCMPKIIISPEWMSPDKIITSFKEHMDDDSDIFFTTAPGILYDITFAGFTGRALEVKYVAKKSKEKLFARYISFESNKYLIFISIGNTENSRDLEYLFKNIDSSFHIDE